MSRGDIGLGDEQPLFTLAGRHLRRAAQHVTRNEVVNLLPPCLEDTFRHPSTLFERPLVCHFALGASPSLGEAQPLEENHLHLSDTKPFHVSRNHFAIERGPDGIQVRDRGSYVGTIVNSLKVGGDRLVGTVPLAVGENEVVVGSPKSPVRFRVVVALRRPDSYPDHEHDFAARATLCPSRF